MVGRVGYLPLAAILVWGSQVHQRLVVWELQGSHLRRLGAQWPVTIGVVLLARTGIPYSMLATGQEVLEVLAWVLLCISCHLVRLACLMGVICKVGTVMLFRHLRIRGWLGHHQDPGFTQAEECTTTCYHKIIQVHESSWDQIHAEYGLQTFAGSPLLRCAAKFVF